MTTNENPAAVRVCAIADIECSRGCGTGPCKREAESSQPAAAPIARNDPNAVTRLKAICRKLGLESAFPDEVYSDPEGLFVIFGRVREAIDRMVQPAPSPADERAAFEAALDKRAKSAGFEVGRMTECELDNAWWGWQAARAASANETGAEVTRPSGYAYRYRSLGGSVIRFNGGGEVNGSRPIEAIPYWFAAPQPAQADAPAETRALPMMCNAFRVTEVSGDPDPAEQRFYMRFSFPSIEALHAADDEWRKFIAPAQADARVGHKSEGE